MKQPRYMALKVQRTIIKNILQTAPEITDGSNNVVNPKMTPYLAPIVIQERRGSSFYLSRRTFW